jgi:hypothetical protein
VRLNYDHHLLYFQAAAKKKKKKKKSKKRSSEVLKEGVDDNGSSGTLHLNCDLLVQNFLYPAPNIPPLCLVVNTPPLKSFILSELV